MTETPNINEVLEQPETAAAPAAELSESQASVSEASQATVSEALNVKPSTMGTAGVINKINQMDTDIENKKKPKFNKMIRILIFLFFFIFIFKIIDKIFVFYNINRDAAYVYFIWFILIFFLFVLLPLRKSYLKNK